MSRFQRRSSRREGHWLVLAAWPPELAALDRALPRLSAKLQARVTLGSVGVGLVESAIGSANLLAKYAPDVVVLVGTAGVYPAYAGKLLPGQVAIAQKVVLVSESSARKESYLPGPMPSQVHPSRALARRVHRATGSPLVDVACPLAISCSTRAATVTFELCGCTLENLEAFAVARAAAVMKVPFAAVLGIANCVGEHAHRDWKRNAAAAAEKACQAVLATLLGLRPAGSLAMRAKGNAVRSDKKTTRSREAEVGS